MVDKDYGEIYNDSYLLQKWPIGTIIEVEIKNKKLILKKTKGGFLELTGSEYPLRFSNLDLSYLATNITVLKNGNIIYS